jgi:hypothetical protein
MVAVHAIDEIADPRKVVQRIYDGGDRDDRIHHLPSAVTKHFADLFLSASALHQVTEISHLPASC